MFNLAGITLGPVPRRRMVAAAAVSAALMVVAVPGTGHAQGGGQDQVTLCHQTGDGSYETITVSASGAENGHGNHDGDIIPAPAGGCPTGSPAPQDGRVTICHMTGDDEYVKITIAQAGWDNGHSTHPGDILLTPSSASASCADAASLAPAVPAIAALASTGAEHTRMLIGAALALLSGLCLVRVGNKRVTS